MGLPKKRHQTPLSDRAGGNVEEDLNAALDFATGENLAEQENKEKKGKPVKKRVNKKVEATAEIPEPKVKKKMGRPPLKENRTGRILGWVEPDIETRFNAASLVEQGKRLVKGEKSDKSLFVEEAIVEWLESRGH